MRPPVDVPDFRAVASIGMSRLGDVLSESGCRRRAIDSDEVLSSRAPGALLGTVRHRILEAAVRGYWKAARGATAVSFSDLGDLRSEGGRQQIAEQLVKIVLNRVDEEFEQTEPWRTPLARAWTRIDWHNEVVRLVSLARASLASERVQVSLGGMKAPEKLARGQRRTEVPLESSSLRLRGVADYVEWNDDNVVRIVDYKSGKVLDDQGELEEHYALQLQGYALAFEDTARERIGAFKLEVVADSGTYDVDGGGQALTRLRHRLEAVSIPWGDVVSARQFESPGAACTYCRQRPGCASYTEYAEKGWERNIVGLHQRPLPLDIWGVLEAVSTGVDGYRLTLRSPDGSRRLITGVSARHFQPSLPAAGQAIHLYDLRTAEGPRNGRFVHPVNFHEANSIPSLSAWTTQVYVTEP